MSPRTGRPTNDPKTSQYRVRLSENDLDKLNYCCENTGKPKSEIIRLGIEKVFMEVKRQKEEKK